MKRIQRTHLLAAPDDLTAGHQNSPQEIREQADPAVWDTSAPGQTQCVLPKEIRLKSRVKYSGKRQQSLMPKDGGDSNTAY